MQGEETGNLPKDALGKTAEVGCLIQKWAERSWRCQCPLGTLQKAAHRMRSCIEGLAEMGRDIVVDTQHLKIILQFCCYLLKIISRRPDNWSNFTLGIKGLVDVL